MIFFRHFRLTFSFFEIIYKELLKLFFDRAKFKIILFAKFIKRLCIQVNATRYITSMSPVSTRSGESRSKLRSRIVELNIRRVSINPLNLRDIIMPS